MSRRRTKNDQNPPRLPANLPGDIPQEELVQQMIRVDHAGEYGATRIYEGQLSVMRSGPDVDVIKEMAIQEKRHLSRFEDLMIKRRVRPSVLSPLWHVVGYALGAATGLLGPKAAMACTAAVEEVIDKHYQEQASALGENETELRLLIEECREDEEAHRDIALDRGAKDATGYELMSGAIKTGSRIAIWLAKRF